MTELWRLPARVQVSLDDCDWTDRCFEHCAAARLSAYSIPTRNAAGATFRLHRPWGTGCCWPGGLFTFALHVVRNDGASMVHADTARTIDFAFRGLFIHDFLA